MEGRAMYAMTENGIPADACSIERAAHETGFSPRLIRSWADEGKIWKGKARGWHVLVSPAEVARYGNTVVTVRRPSNAD
jgi:hypothetical protein